MKPWGASIVALVFLISLWSYQLPYSVELRKILDRTLSPIQKITFTNRRYAMYAPNPRPWKQRATLKILSATQGPIFYNFDDPQVIGKKFNSFSTERWANFIDHLAKSLLGEWSLYPPELGRKQFKRLAHIICQQHSSIPAKAISLQVSEIGFGKVRHALEKGATKTLSTIACKADPL